MLYNKAYPNFILSRKLYSWPCSFINLGEYKLDKILWGFIKSYLLGLWAIIINLSIFFIRLTTVWKLNIGNYYLNKDKLC